MHWWSHCSLRTPNWVGNWPVHPVGILAGTFCNGRQLWPPLCLLPYRRVGARLCTASPMPVDTLSLQLQAVYLKENVGIISSAAAILSGRGPGSTGKGLVLRPGKYARPLMFAIFLGFQKFALKVRVRTAAKAQKKLGFGLEEILPSMAMQCCTPCGYCAAAELVLPLGCGLLAVWLFYVIPWCDPVV